MECAYCGRGLITDETPSVLAFQALATFVRQNNKDRHAVLSKVY